MARKTFKRSGIRRDRNLSDLSNKEEALNNLLDTLVDGLDSTFITQDLDSIRNLFSNNMTSENYRSVIGSAVENTTANGINLPAFPRITYQNRLDRFKIYAGTPIYNGGDGLTANYFNSDQVVLTGSTDPTVDNIFSGVSTALPIPSDTFWESGNFDYTGKLHPQSVNSSGGVKWEGFFVPIETGVHNFYVNSTQGFTADFQADGYVSGVGTYTEYLNIGFTTTLGGSTAAQDGTITIIPADSIKYIGLGMSVTGPGINPGSYISAESEGGIDRTTGVITLSNDEYESPIDYQVTTPGTYNFTFFRDSGKSASSSFPTQVLNAFTPYRIKFRFYVDPNASTGSGVDRSIDINFSTPSGSTSTNLRYSYLYSLFYDFNNPGSFNEFVNKSVLFGGGSIGGNGLSQYVSVETTKKVDIKYQPKTNLDSIRRSPVSYTGSVVAGSPVINVSDTTNLEIGNYVFSNELPYQGSRITDIIINESIIVETLPTSTNSNSNLTVIDHRGFIRRATTTGIYQDGNGKGVLSLQKITNVDLPEECVMISSYTSAYTVARKTSSTNGVPYGTTYLEFNPYVAAGGSYDTYFYYSRGLVDESLTSFCNPSLTRCLMASSDVAAGNIQIPVENTYGIQTGWKVQGFQFQDGTTINSIGSNPPRVTLSKVTAKNIVTGGNFTVTNASDPVSDDRQLCCPPTDTSPPFNPTLDGLETTPAEPNLRIENGNIVFYALGGNVDEAKISDYLETDFANNRLQIKVGDGRIFNILCV